MNTFHFIRCATLIGATIAITGCACSARCRGGEPMARPRVALRDVHFAFDSAELSPTAKQTLREDYEALGLGDASTGAKIVLEGRADERGDAGYNQRLSQRRASEVKSYLRSLGAAESQFESRSLGERSPIAEGSDPDAWARNRTVRVLAM